MKNKKAGFWIKLLSRLIDILPIAVSTVTVAFLIMSHSPLETGGENIWHFTEPWTFYVWGLMLITLLLLTFIVIPLLTKGQTIGQIITRIKVTSEGDIRRAILKRELFFGWTWIFTSILVFAFINHTLITKYATTNKTHIIYTNFESLRIGIVTSVGSIGMVIQMIIGISVLVRKDKTGLHDRLAKSSVVYKNKFIKVEKKKLETIVKIKPKSSRNVIVEWIK